MKIMQQGGLPMKMKMKKTAKMSKLKKKDKAKRNDLEKQPHHLLKKKKKRRTEGMKTKKEEGENKSSKREKKKKKKMSGGSNFSEKLAALAKSDPELYEYLRQEEADIFNDDEDDQQGEEGGGGGAEGGDDAAAQGQCDRHGDGGDEDELEIEAEDASIVDYDDDMKKPKRQRVELTAAVIDRSVLDRLEKALVIVAEGEMAKPTTKRLEKGVRKAVTCLRASLSLYGFEGGGGVDGEDNDKSKKRGGGKSRPPKQQQKQQAQAYAAGDEEVGDAVICLCLAHVAPALLALLDGGGKKGAKNKDKRKMKAKKSDGKVPGRLRFSNWKRVAPLARDFCYLLNWMVSELRDDSTFVLPGLEALNRLAPFLVHVRKQCRLVSKTLVKLWSTKGSQPVRAAATATLCSIAKLNPETMFPPIYKDCYRAYISETKIVDGQTVTRLAWMQGAFAELTLLCPQLAYDLAFVYIRQFAIHLRNAVIAKRKDLIQTVYNWQFVKGLEMWAVVLCQAVKLDETPQRRFLDLAHPLIEIISVLRNIFPSSKYMPLRVHCVRLLLRLQSELGVYVPTLAYAVELLPEVLELVTAKRPPANSPATGPKSAQQQQQAAPSLDHLLRLSSTVHQQQQLLLVGHGGGGEHGRLVVVVADAVAQLIRDAVKCSSTEKQNKAEVGKRSQLALPHYEAVPIRLRLKLFLKQCSSSSGNNRTNHHDRDQLVRLFKPLVHEIEGSLLLLSH